MAGNPVACAACLFSIAAILAYVYFLITASPWISDRGVLTVFCISLTALLIGAYGLLSARRKRLPGTALAAFAIAIGLLGALLFAARTYNHFWSYYNEGRLPGAYHGCQANLKRIRMGLQLHEAANGKAPPDFAALVRKGQVPQSAFVCPASNDREWVGASPEQQAAALSKPGFCSYIYVGRELRLKDAPGDMILVYERLQNHESGINVLCADGKVEWLHLKRARHVIAQLEAGQNPPRD